MPRLQDRVEQLPGLESPYRLDPRKPLFLGKRLRSAHHARARSRYRASLSSSRSWSRSSPSEPEAPPLSLIAKPYFLILARRVGRERDRLGVPALPGVFPELRAPGALVLGCNVTFTI